MDTVQENYKFQRYIVVLGIALLLIKFTAWIITDSVAILTDAMESIVNVVAGFIGLYALYLSGKPRDRDHPYGHGKVEYISASIEGAMISMAGIIILIEAVNSILSPKEIESLDIGLVLVAIAAIANFIAGTMAVRKGEKNRSQALIASGKHLRSDTYSSAGIIIGLVLMFALQKMGYDAAWLDGAIALLFGAIIVITGVKVIKSSFDGIMDKADWKILDEVVECLNENRHDDWIDIHNLRVIKNGWMLHIDMHVTLPCMMTVKQQYYEICEVKKAVKDKFGGSVELSIMGEPCHKFSCPRCERECEDRLADFTGLIIWSVENLSEDKQHGRDDTTSS